MKPDSNFYTKAATVIIISIVILSIYFFATKNTSKKPLVSNSGSSHLSPVTSNGSIILKSFQSSTSEDFFARSQGSVTSQREPAAEKKSIRKSKPKNEGSVFPNTVNVDGTSYVWLNSQIARLKKDGVGQVNSPDGFEIIKAEKLLKNFGVFDENALFIVTDKFGFEKRVVTGVLIVELRDISLADALAASNQIDMAYLAPQIQTVLFRLRNGQNIFEKEKELRSSPDVKSVKIEILGKGATIK